MENDVASSAGGAAFFVDLSDESDASFCCGNKKINAAIERK